MTMLTMRKFLNDRNGATAIEYGLIASLISLAIIGGVTLTGTSLQDLWDGNSGKIVEGLNRN
ncbi:Flp family type IVb pilin [Mesorhizobium sp. SB112]|uniref:Flp family type IVb pilin n=1 Tax=Mesorhizobium sp. SB112 TaxID=3151853 RepID=UPI0032663717